MIFEEALACPAAQVSIADYARQFDREYVKSLTPKELKDRLVVLGERLVASRRREGHY